MTLLLKKMKWNLYRSLLLCLIGDGAEIVLDVKKEKRETLPWCLDNVSRKWVTHILGLFKMPEERRKN